MVSNKFYKRGACARVPAQNAMAIVLLSLWRSLDVHLAV
jgi:hypothetical protein